MLHPAKPLVNYYALSLSRSLLRSNLAVEKNTQTKVTTNRVSIQFRQKNKINNRKDFEMSKYVL